MSFYHVNHCTEFHYDQPVHENIFILYMKPLENEYQKLDTFNLNIWPHAKLFEYKDYNNNNRHVCSIVKEHQDLKIQSSFKIKVKALEPLPDDLDPKAWKELEQLQKTEKMWTWLQSGYFTRSSEALLKFIKDSGIKKEKDPLSSLKKLNKVLFSLFEYSPQSTNAQSPIEEILSSKKGVCQDYSHVMISIARLWSIPSRYVSGYLYQDKDYKMSSISDQSHAWCEFYLPSLGWRAFDPTNNCEAQLQHIKTAVGLDYKDVPPHKGLFKGSAGQSLKVSVKLKKLD